MTKRWKKITPIKIEDIKFLFGFSKIALLKSLLGTYRDD